MSNPARKQLGIQLEVLRNVGKHEVLTSRDLHVGQSVMYQDSVTKQWYPAVITSLCQEKRSFKITTGDGCCVQKNASTSQALYTKEQEVTSSTVCVTTNGTMKSYVVSETIDGTIWPQEVLTSEQWITSTYKQT